MRLPKKITARWLRARRACQFEVSLFEKTFPDGATITAANKRKAERAGLTVAWLLHLLDVPDRALKACPRFKSARYNCNCDNLKWRYLYKEHREVPA